MRKRGGLWDSLQGRTGIWLPLFGGLCVLILSFWLRGLPFAPAPSFDGQLQFTSGVLALTFAGSALVRFQGTRTFFPLILAVGFVVVGITLASSSFLPSNSLPAEANASLRDPMSWVIGRTLLAMLLIAALLVEHRYLSARKPSREIAVALVAVVLLTVLLSAVHRHLPTDFVVFPGTFFPRPGNLIPAVFFLIATVGYGHRLRRTPEVDVIDRALYFAVTLNFWCSLAATVSDRRLDAAFALAAVLQFASYFIMMGGALLDNLHLFRKIHRLATSDPVTGLANHRQFMDSLETELKRTSRSRRPFAVLLFDLDGLKKINDQFGHQVGTRALCRVAEVLRGNSRAIDTGARYGGDEFALILPETSEREAKEVLQRVCDRVAERSEAPPISVSGGLAMYPRDGKTIETLVDSADRSLYRMKSLHKGNPHLAKQTGT
jgi:diguanylate cyclase (GGDEF)-like protein